MTMPSASRSTRATRKKVQTAAESLKKKVMAKTVVDFQAAKTVVDFQDGMPPLPKVSKVVNDAVKELNAVVLSSLRSPTTKRLLPSRAKELGVSVHDLDALADPGGPMPTTRLFTLLNATGWMVTIVVAPPGPMMTPTTQVFGTRRKESA